MGWERGPTKIVAPRRLSFKESGLDLHVDINNKRNWIKRINTCLSNVNELWLFIKGGFLGNIWGMRCAFGSLVSQTRTVACATTCATSRPRCASTAGTEARVPRSRTAANDFPTVSASGRSIRPQDETTSPTENASTNSRDLCPKSQDRRGRGERSWVCWLKGYFVTL